MSTECIFNGKIVTLLIKLRKYRYTPYILILNKYFYSPTYLEASNSCLKYFLLKIYELR